MNELLKPIKPQTKAHVYNNINKILVSAPNLDCRKEK